MKLYCLFLLIFLAVLVAWVAPTLSEAAGPWKAQVVDAETGKPLEGAVVLAMWERRTPGPGHPFITFYDSEEVMSDPNGQFIIPSRSTWTLIPFSSIEGPRIFMFKPGYGQWRFKGEDEWLKLDTYERNMRYKEVWGQFEGQGVMIELPLLKTREERLRFLSAPTGLIPDDRMQNYLKALDQERINLGLKPGYSK